MIIAIAASFFFHLFWISIIKVVIVPEKVARIKFSKVSVFSPALGTSAFEVRMEPKARSFLEKGSWRYVEEVAQDVPARQEPGFVKDYYILSRRSAADAVQVKKIVPTPFFGEE